MYESWLTKLWKLQSRNAISDTFLDGFGLLCGGGAIAQPRVHGSWEEAFLPALPTDDGATKSLYFVKVVPTNQILVLCRSTNLEYCPLIVVPPGKAQYFV